MIQKQMRYTAITILLILINLITQAQSQRSAVDSQEEIDYILNKNYRKDLLKKEHHKYTKTHNQQITLAHLKQFSQAQRFKQRQFLRDNPWTKWEKREQYNALERWLHKISPIIKN